MARYQNPLELHIWLRFSDEVYGPAILWLKIFWGKSIKAMTFNDNQRNCRNNRNVWNINFEFSLSTFCGFIGEEIMSSLYYHAPPMFRRAITFLVTAEKPKSLLLYSSCDLMLFYREESPNYLPQACAWQTKHNKDFFVAPKPPFLRLIYLELFVNE